MKIAILGAGFTGLAAALRLSEAGHNTTIFEKEKNPGGLATSFSNPEWNWQLERHYHHIFTSDHAILSLAKEANHKILFTKPKTSTFSHNNTHQLDSLTSLLKFPHLSLKDKLQTAATLAYVKTTPYWQPLEKATAQNFILKTMGKKSWEILWEPLFKGKFHKDYKKIPASWFWARIKKRSASLGYPEGGFQALAESIKKRTERLGANFLYQTAVVRVKKRGNKITITTENGRTGKFDKVIVTLPNTTFCKIVKELPETYKKRLLSLKSLGALNLILELKTPFLAGNTYWLNINEKTSPFLSIVEHTNFINKKNYGGNHIIYIGNYLPAGHPYFKMTKNELLKIYSPFLKRINPAYCLSPITYYLFRAPFAQPIIPLNYSKILPPLKTPIPNLYLANITQVYPWDRGTNYAVELGTKVAKLLELEAKK